MKTITIELPSEDAEILLSAYSARRAKAVEEKDAAIIVIRDMDERIGRLTFSPERTEKLFPETAPPAIERTPSGRMKRGASEQIIADFMKHRNGSGAQITEIAESTHASYGTTRRVMREFVRRGLAKQIESDFHWIKK